MEHEDEQYTLTFNTTSVFFIFQLKGTYGINLLKNYVDKFNYKYHIEEDIEKNKSKIYQK